MKDLNKTCGQFKVVQQHIALAISAPTEIPFSPVIKSSIVYTYIQHHLSFVCGHDYICMQKLYADLQLLNTPAVYISIGFPILQEAYFRDSELKKCSAEMIKVVAEQCGHRHHSCLS